MTTNTLFPTYTSTQLPETQTTQLSVQLSEFKKNAYISGGNSHNIVDMTLDWLYDYQKDLTELNQKLDSAVQKLYD